MPLKQEMCVCFKMYYCKTLWVLKIIFVNFTQFLQLIYVTFVKTVFILGRGGDKKCWGHQGFLPSPELRAGFRIQAVGELDCLAERGSAVQVERVCGNGFHAASSVWCLTLCQVNRDLVDILISRTLCNSCHWK